MPKIGKDSYQIAGKWTEVETWYGKKEGFYMKGLPDNFGKLTDFTSGRYESEREMCNKFLSSLHEYHEKISKQRKVIVYSLSGSPEMAMNSSEVGCYSGTKPGVSKLFQTPDFCSKAPKYMFGFTYNVLMEVSGQSVKYYPINKEGEVVGNGSSVYKTEVVIDWTEEREQFFKDLQMNLQSLIFNTSKFFDKPNVLTLMDSHGFAALQAPVNAIQEASTLLDVQFISEEKVSLKVQMENSFEMMMITVVQYPNHHIQWYKENIDWLADISEFGIEKWLYKGVSERYISVVLEVEMLGTDIFVPTALGILKFGKI